MGNSSSLSRRFVLRAMAGALTATTVGVRLHAQGEPIARTTPKGRRPTLVVVFLRGGADGLNLVVPHGDEDYYRLRKGLAIPRPGEAGGALDIDGTFGFHPSAPSLKALQAEGLVAALHAVGHPENTRSHFEEQDRWELGASIPKNERQGISGWLNRYLHAAPARGPVRAVSLGHRIARSLSGEVPTLALPSLDVLGRTGGAAGVGLEATMRALGKAYGGDGQGASGSLESVQGGWADALDAVETLGRVADTDAELGGQYPDGIFGARCREAAKLIRADIGVEVISIDLAGFDTHQDQAQPFAARVKALGEGLAALRTDLEGRLDDVLVLTVSEFGRTARVNGTRGTDHGSGSSLLAMGGPVRTKPATGKSAASSTGRDVLGDWPTLAIDALQDRRDLRATTDIRHVYAEVLTEFMELDDLSSVLPGWSPSRVGLLAAQ